MLNVYVLYGAPGVGKGSVCQTLPEENCIGVGRLLRAQNKGQGGELEADSFVNRLIAKELKRHTGYVILDGYPRTEAQADYLLSLKDINLRRVYELTCPDQDLVERLSQRQSCVCGASYHPRLKPSKKPDVCDKCGKKLFRRPDDSPDIVEKRLKQYHQTTEPVLRKFGALVKSVDVSVHFQEMIQSVRSEILSEQVPSSSRQCRRIRQTILDNDREN